MIKLSVIIPCYNGGATLADQLDALTRQTVQPWEIILADNGSTDDSVAIAQRYQDRLPNLRIVDASARRGCGHARNAGAAAASGDAIAFCDTDDIVADTWVAGMSEALTEHDFVAARLEHALLNSASTNELQQNTLLQLDPPFLPYGGGCSLGVKRFIHEAMQGFDEDLLRAQDIDYCLRVQLAGFPLHFAPKAVIHSRHRSTVKGQFEQGFALGENFVLLYKKHRANGMPSMSWPQALKNWLGFFKWVLRSLLRGQGYRPWIWVFGWRLGWIRGCLRYGVFALVTPWPSKEEIRRQQIATSDLPAERIAG